MAAYIRYTNKTSSTLTLQLEGLDPTWDGGNRTIYWYCTVADTSVGPEQDYYGDDSYNNYSTIKSSEGIQCNIKIGGQCTLTGLTKGVFYHIKAEVYDDTPFSYLATVYATYYPPEVLSFNVEQIEPYDERIFVYSATWDNVVYGVTNMYIYARKSGTEEWYKKYSKLIENAWVESSYITVDSFGKYDFKFELDTNGVTDSMECYDVTVEFTPMLSPKITYIYCALSKLSYVDVECTSNMEWITDVVYNLYIKKSSEDSWVLAKSKIDNGGGTTIWDIDTSRNTQYDIFVQVIYDNGKIESSNIITFTTRNIVEASNITSIPKYKSLLLSWDYIYDAMEYNIQIYNHRDNTIASLQNTENNYIMIDDSAIDNKQSGNMPQIDFGTQYQFGILTRYEWLGYDYIDGCQISYETSSERVWVESSTPPAPPSLSLTAQNNKIQVKYGVLTSSGVDSFVFELFSESSYSTLCESITVTNGVSSNLNPSGSTSFNGSYNTGTYYVRARTYYNSLGSITESGAEYVYATITISSTRPENWDWNASNQTLNAYNAINKVSDYTVKDFSYLVWNDFVDKVGEFLTYKKYDTAAINEEKYGFPSNTTYAQMLPYAKMNNTDVDGNFLTAKRFNIVRYCIGSMKSTGIPEQSSGNTAYGHYFITLAEVLNSIT